MPGPSSASAGAAAAAAARDGAARPAPRLPLLLPPPEPEVDPAFSILFETDRLAVVAKSGNLPCHPSGRYRRHTLERLLLDEAGFPAVHFASRLDRETSGAVLVAKDAETAGALGRALMAHRFGKRYLCLARGAWREPEGPDGWAEVRGWIVPASDALVHKFRAFLREGTVPDGGLPPGAQPACTRFRTVPWSALGVAPGLAEGFVALECEPVTGRTHQIRATVRALGLEVAGDKLYGPDRAIYARLCAGAMTPADRAALGLSRQALHAWRLDFREPATGLPRSVTAPPDALLAEFSAWRAM